MEYQDNTPEILLGTEQTTIAREFPPERKTAKRRIGFFTGEEQHEITLEEGSEYTRNYRRTAGRDAVLGGYFGREIIEKILNQKNCVGIRIYYGRQSDGKATLVLTGGETNNADLYQGILGQEYPGAPSLSAIPNALNSDNWKKAVPVRSTKVLTGKENQFLTLAEASQSTRNYRDSMKVGEAKGGFFGATIFRKILAQEGCVGIHIYRGMHDDGTPTFVLVGVNEHGSDLVSGIVAQKAFICPPWCYVFGPLNK
jgi:hypothetical protein